jgi:hypothetical protein
MKGMIGATLTLSGLPASVGVRVARSRRAGETARGSSVRAISPSSVVMAAPG